MKDQRGDAYVWVTILIVIGMVGVFLIARLMKLELNYHREQYSEQFGIELPERYDEPRYSEPELAVIRPSVCATLRKLEREWKLVSAKYRDIENAEPSTEPAKSQKHLDQLITAKVLADEKFEAWSRAREIAHFIPGLLVEDACE
jgi:hypothetical protein